MIYKKNETLLCGVKLKRFIQNLNKVQYTDLTYKVEHFFLLMTSYFIFYSAEPTVWLLSHRISLNR